MISLVPFLACFVICAAVEENVLCGPKSCDDAKCPELPEKCKIQNATHNGVFLPSLEMCNCCQYCLENLNEGETCSIGNPSTKMSQTICGPRLSCTLSPNQQYDGTCEKMDTYCVKNQTSFDERKKKGTLGNMEVRKKCDDDGQFLSYNCIPGQSCYCVDVNGSRIFGEMDFTSLPDVDLQCKCSRDLALANIIIGRELNPTEHFRCTANGDYDKFQRINDKFLCVDSSDGAPTYPDELMVNSSLATQLKCYHKGEDDDMYYNKCEKEYVEVLKEVQKYDYDIVFGYTYPKCDPDGTYQAVQENSTHKMCVDKQGEVLNVVDKKTKKF
ncbi:uncharacterized protein [Leptinotarsa decemlineata]|uniref:uncharacterized protein n=1 Tax=Leptinotarsa decemlineata TaxID=7539 RepID=UPI003D307569